MRPLTINPRCPPDPPLGRKAERFIGKIVSDKQLFNNKRQTVLYQIFLRQRIILGTNSHKIGDECSENVQKYF